MYISDFCNKENCMIINMQDECILIFNDKFVFSFLNKDSKIDFQTFPKQYKLGSFVGAIALGIFSLAPWYLAMKHQYDSFYIFLIMTICIFAMWLYRIFGLSGTTEIHKEDIKKIRMDAKRIGMEILFKEGKRTKKRIIKWPKDNNEQKMTIQLLKEKIAI